MLMGIVHGIDFPLEKLHQQAALMVWDESTSSESISTILH
jgi:hypothetical protein